jgi:hypothetical protein
VDTEDQVITEDLEANGGDAQPGEDNERTGPYHSCTKAFVPA